MYYIYIYTHTHKIFLHSSVDRHLDCFHILVTVNHAAVNTGLHVPFQTSVFFSLNIWLGVESVVLFSFFEEPPYCFPQ